MGQTVTYVTPHVMAITGKFAEVSDTEDRLGGDPVFRLDYLSCILTISSTILIGKRYWQGWVVGAVNSVVVCFIGYKTAQFGFIPANLFCIGICAHNLRIWRKTEDSSPASSPKRLSGWRSWSTPFRTS
jgi:hypothetical protein